MVSKRRRGRPRKTGHRYKNGNLKSPSHDPAISPAAIAATQPHRQGLGDHAADQLAESELGRMVIRGIITRLQCLAGQKYAAQWRSYLATLDGPRSPQRGHGRGNPCAGCTTAAEREKCACDLARRSWVRSASALHAIPGGIVVTARVCCWDVPCPVWGLAMLRSGLDTLALSLGLTTRNKSQPVENLNPNYVRHA